jgi:hypothetical protein
MKQKTLIYFLILMVSVAVLGCTDNSKADVTPQDMVVDTNPTTPTEPTPSLASTIGIGYIGKILAGDKTPYIEFNTKDYERATTDGKVILLYFYSEINPNCKTDETKILKAFNSMENNKMIGFKVHIGDNLATVAETQLATNFDVKDSRTKVILKNSKVMQKSSTSWDINTYAAQMSLYLN